MRLRHGSPRKIFHWIKYKYGNNQYGILGPFKSENEANQEAFTKLSGLVFEVVALDTRNKNAASGKMKAVILGETNDISQAMQRMRRKDPNPEQFHSTEGIGNPTPIIY
jgi:hypothetical protein